MRNWDPLRFRKCGGVNLELATCFGCPGPDLAGGPVWPVLPPRGITLRRRSIEASALRLILPPRGITLRRRSYEASALRVI